LELLESSTEFESVVVLDIVDLVLALFVPAAQVGDLLAQVEGTEEEANHEPSGGQCSGINVLGLVGIPNLALTDGHAFSRVVAGRSHNYGFVELVVPAVNCMRASRFVIDIKANWGRVFFSVQDGLGVCNPQVEAEAHHDADE